MQAEREIIYKRIEQRVDQMFDTIGLVEEAKKLYPYKHLNALQTFLLSVGYKELFALCALF